MRVQEKTVMIYEVRKKLEDRKAEWWQWHRENPQVWDRFREYTFEAISAGRKNYSHWAIMNRIRWNKEIETRGGEFKISNDYIAFYARLFHVLHPKHDEFFNLKPLKEEKELARLADFNSVSEQV